MLYLSDDQELPPTTEANAIRAGLSDAAKGVYDLRHGRETIHRVSATWIRR
jgi:hypothetical protein